MKKLCCVALLAALCAVAFPSVPNAEEKSGVVVVHYFVVPSVLPGGVNAAERLPALRMFLSKLAGGYTQLGMTQGGWVNPKGGLETERNISFLVSAEKDVSKEIAAYLDRHFPAKARYLLVWDAVRKN